MMNESNQTRFSLKSICVVALSFLILGCAKQTYVSDIDTSYYRINKRSKSSEKIDEMIAPYKGQLDSKMKEVIAQNPIEMMKSRPNSLLGNWFADVLHSSGEKMYGNIDFAVQNYGGLRIPSLAAGEVTVGHIYELMPFDNKMLVLEMQGNVVQKLLDRIAEKGGWPISYGLTFMIENDKATNVIIDDEPLSMQKVYRVIIPDYIANGGDQCFFLKDEKREDKDVLLREVMIDYLKNKPEDKKTIEVNQTRRISTHSR